MNNKKKIAEPVSLKFLQSNKKDTRSPEHLSELRKALGEALKNEQHDTNTRIQTNDPSSREDITTTEHGTNKKDAASENEKQVVPASANGFSAAQQATVTAAVAEAKPRRRRMRKNISASPPHRGEIPEDKLRNMLKVEE